MTEDIQLQLAALASAANSRQGDRGFARYVTRQRKLLQKELALWARVDRRIAESTRLVALLPASERTTKEELDKIRELAGREMRSTGQSNRTLLHLAVLDLAVVTVAIRIAAPVALFTALFLLPLAFVRFVIAKARFAIASRRARGATR